METQAEEDLDQLVYWAADTNSQPIIEKGRWDRKSYTLAINQLKLWSFPPHLWTTRCNSLH